MTLQLQLPCTTFVQLTNKKLKEDLTYREVEAAVMPWSIHKEDNGKNYAQNGDQQCIEATQGAGYWTPDEKIKNTSLTPSSHRRGLGQFIHKYSKDLRIEIGFMNDSRDV